MVQNQLHYLPEEIEFILKRMGMDEHKIEFDFELKETVTVNEGPFANFTGSIEEIDSDKNKAKGTCKYVRT